MKNSFFSRFAPKEPKFFPWLKELSDIAIGTSELLIDNLQKDTADERAACYKLIKELERKADVLANHVTDELSTTFITPFDREDIHELTAAIDDVVDGLPFLQSFLEGGPQLHRLVLADDEARAASAQCVLVLGLRLLWSVDELLQIAVRPARASVAHIWWLLQPHALLPHIGRAQTGHAEGWAVATGGL